MKYWTFWGWIAYGCLAIAAYGMAFWTFVERHPTMIDWFPTYLRSYMWGYVPAALVSFATIILIIQWIRDKRPTEVEKAGVLPLISISAPSPVAAKPKKFYSDRNKSDLANALTDLLEIFNRDGSKIIQKAQQIIEEWRPPGIQDRVIGKKSPDIAATIDQLDKMSNLAATFNQDLFKDNGFIKKYQTYSDELCPILQIQQNISQILDHPIIELQSAINSLRNYLSSVRLAEKYNDQNLIISMMSNSWPSFEKYRNCVNLFKKWLNETKKRIAIFRDSHL